jgi:hypothetical protein
VQKTIKKNNYENNLKGKEVIDLLKEKKPIRSVLWDIRVKD